MSRMHALLMFLVAAALPVAAAHADTLDTLTFNFPAYTFSFPNPTITFPALNFTISVPASVALINNFYCTVSCFSFVANVNGQSNVFDVTATSISFTPGDANDIQTSPIAYAVIDTPLLFSGSFTQPTFVAGAYNAGFAYAHSFPYLASPGTVTISGPAGTSPVPEPSTMILLGTGLFGCGVLGFASRIGGRDVR